MSGLVELQKVKTVLTLGDDQDDLLQFLIDSASVHGENIARRKFAAGNVELKISSIGGSSLIVPGYPINSISRLCADRNRLFPAAKDIPANQYGVDQKAGIIRLYAGRFPWGYDVVLFAGNVGYVDIPADIQQATIEIVSANFRRFSNIGGLVGIKQMSANGAITTQYEIDVPLTARSVFMSYRGARI